MRLIYRDRFKNTLHLLQLLIILLFLNSCSSEPEKVESTPSSAKSPSGANEIIFVLTKEGKPGYFVKHNEKLVMDTSFLGFDFRDQEDMTAGFQLQTATLTEINEEWEMPWGEQRKVLNQGQELMVALKEKTTSKRELNLYFRAYDDGVAFRYELPEQEGMDTVIILDELTEFQLTGDHMSWWCPGDWDSYEHPFYTEKVSEIDALALKKNGLLGSNIMENAVSTPFTMKMEDGVHLSIHEANLTDYAGMTLRVLPGLKLNSGLVGSERTGYKVKRAVAFKSPWRTIQIGDKATDLLTSNLIVNLNEPNKIGDVSYFKPKKYNGIWWEMHIEKATWDYKSGKHGATTENAKKYIDFASENGLEGVLVEGWNTGWEHWIGFEDREGVFDFVTPYPDYDLKEVVEYGKSKGVELIMHHETSAAPRTYAEQLDTAYKLMHSLGIHSVKTGYVGPIIPKGEHHHGQWMVNHYRSVLEQGAKYQVAINAHEPIKPTGIRRTYPNAISREGARGQEFNAWAADGGNPAEHLSILAFTRMLAGPMDFTPGVFDIVLPTKPNNQINTTLAHQLALYVVVYSPVQMACDLPENYEGQPGFQFIRDVGVDWDETVAINGEVGDFVTIARKERESGSWFVGGITDETERSMKVALDFLEEGKSYQSRIYKDGEGAHFKKNPTSLVISEMVYKKGDVIDLELAAGGGFAISLIPMK